MLFSTAQTQCIGIFIILLGFVSVLVGIVFYRNIYNLNKEHFLRLYYEKIDINNINYRRVPPCVLFVVFFFFIKIHDYQAIIQKHGFFSFLSFIMLSQYLFMMSFFVVSSEFSAQQQKPPFFKSREHFISMLGGAIILTGVCVYSSATGRYVFF